MDRQSPTDQRRPRLADAVTAAGRFRRLGDVPAASTMSVAGDPTRSDRLLLEVGIGRATADLDDVGQAAHPAAAPPRTGVTGGPLGKVEGPVSGAWMRGEAAATITVVTGAPTTAEVLVGFGADPTQPLRGAMLHRGLLRGEVLLARATEDIVLVIEPGGSRGTHYEVLCRLSPGRRAASWCWSADGPPRLSLAANGCMLATCSPGLGSTPAHPALGWLWDDIDFDTSTVTVADQALAVIERFTDFRVTVEDFLEVWDCSDAYKAHNGAGLFPPVPPCER